MKALIIKQALVAMLFLGITGFCQGQLYRPAPMADKAVIHDFIQQNLRYPEDAFKEGRNGKVVVSFYVDEKGNGSQYHVTESFCGDANANALDLVRKIRWSPAMLDMKPVGCDMEYAKTSCLAVLGTVWLSSADCVSNFV